MVLLLLSFHLPTSFISGWSTTTFTSELYVHYEFRKATERPAYKHTRIFSSLSAETKTPLISGDHDLGVDWVPREFRMRALSLHVSDLAQLQTTHGKPKPHHCSLYLQENLQPCFQCHLAHISKDSITFLRTLFDILSI